MILDGKSCAKQLRQQLKTKIDKFHTSPTLAIIMVGNNKASEIYVRNKNRAAKEVGIQTLNIYLPEKTSQFELLAEIRQLNNSDVDAILLQLPLPKTFSASDTQDIINAIDPRKDVDGFHPMNLGHMFTGKLDNTPVPCTPKGIMYLLSQYHINLDGKLVVVVGRSNIVGKPLSSLMLAQNATVIMAHSHTKNLTALTQQADVVVMAVGQAEMLTADMIKDDAIVIDVGINHQNGKLVGDVAFDEVNDKAAYITPVPGGVGPLTVAMLLEQTTQLHCQANQHNM